MYSLPVSDSFFLPLFVTFLLLSFFFFNATATPEIYTLSLHDALPIYGVMVRYQDGWHEVKLGLVAGWVDGKRVVRSEEHTSELQSHSDLVCRLLLEKKKRNVSSVVELESVTCVQTVLDAWLRNDLWRG